MKDARELEGELRFTEALDIYQKVLLQEPENEQALYGAGICYLKSRHREKALPFLQKLFKKNPAYNPNLKFHLAEAYQINNFFREARKYYLEFKRDFEKLKQQTKDKKDAEELEEEIKRFDKLVKECEYGEKYINSPVNAQIENIGSAINSVHPDYAPVISADESVLVFTSRREDTTGECKDENDGLPCEDIYISYFKDGKWTPAQNIGKPINTSRHDACIALSPDGKKLFVYRDNVAGTGDIYYSTQKPDGSWTPIKEFDAVNSKYHETSITITADGKTVYFSSDRPGGYGRLDIYKCTLNEKGKWSEPVNLGPTINTPYDDDSPFITNNGKTLYFSSCGHTTMGGYDIFKSEWDEKTQKWTTPENLGYPINTADDDVFFVIAANGKRGYYASPKEGGFGEKDIYVIKMPEPQLNTLALKTQEAPKPKPIEIKPIEIKPVEVQTPKNTIEVFLMGKITEKGTKNPLEAQVKIKELSTDEEVAVHISNKETGEYEETVVKPNQSYLVSVQKEGYLFHSEVVSIPKVEQSQIFRADFELTKIKKGAIANLKVFFDFDKATLRPESKPEMENFLAFLKNNPKIKVEIAGHTDNIGTDQKNLILSTQRAKAVMDYLIDNGIEEERLVYKGYGFHRPIAPNQNPDGSDNPEGRQLNRRTECIIIDF
ncbi:MAG: OmpA family protein [Microscillaceae bacterium]|nr:OmpA family protein [Microscillaceae bacterium]MDW8461450.1 OmpA family protein [Cytophagales bacterium]